MTGGGEGPDAASWTLDLRGTQPVAVAQVRRWVGMLLADVDDECLVDFRLVVTEILANAYDHGNGPRQIRMSRDRTGHQLRIEVEDHCRDHPTRGGSRVDSSRGHGMIIVAGLAADWGYAIIPTPAARLHGPKFRSVDNDRRSLAIGTWNRRRPWRTLVSTRRVIPQSRSMRPFRFTMCGVNDDSRTDRRRHNAAVDRIETVPMTAEQYDGAVNALATLIVEWMTALQDHNGPVSGHPNLN